MAVTAFPDSSWNSRAPSPGWACPRGRRYGWGPGVSGGFSPQVFLCCEWGWLAQAGTYRCGGPLSGSDPRQHSSQKPSYLTFLDSVRCPDLLTKRHDLVEAVWHLDQLWGGPVGGTRALWRRARPGVCSAVRLTQAGESSSEPLDQTLTVHLRFQI